jgi:hypothetical protein
VIVPGGPSRLARRWQRAPQGRRQVAPPRVVAASRVTSPVDSERSRARVADWAPEVQRRRGGRPGPLSAGCGTLRASRHRLAASPRWGPGAGAISVGSRPSSRSAKDRALRSLPTGSRPPRSCARGARGAPQAGAVGSAIALLHALLSLPLMRPEFAPLTREQGSPRTTPSYPAEGEAQVVTNLACARGSSTPRSAVRVVPPILGEGTEEEVDWQGHLAALAGRFPREHCSVRRHGFLRRLRPLLRSTSPSASFV